MVRHSSSGLSQKKQRTSAEPGLKIRLRERGRVGLGRVDVDGEGHLLGRLAVDQAHQVNAGLVGVGVAEARSASVGLETRTTSPEGRTTSTSGSPRPRSAALPGQRYVDRRPGQAHRSLGLGAGKVKRQPRDQRKEERLQRQVGPVNVNAGSQKQHRAGPDGPLCQQAAEPSSSLIKARATVCEPQVMGKCL